MAHRLLLCRSRLFLGCCCRCFGISFGVLRIIIIITIIGTTVVLRFLGDQRSCLSICKIYQSDTRIYKYSSSATTTN